MHERTLDAIVADIVSGARGSEQIEAYAVRSRDTEIRAYEGDVESLSSADIDGVGVRIVVDGRQGYAWAGSLDHDVIAETVAEARDNASFGAADEFNALVSPADFAGVPVATLDIWRDELIAMPVDEKVSITLQLERAVRAADARITGVEATDWHDAVVESAVANSLGVSGSTRRTTCSVSVEALASEGDDATQTGFGFAGARHAGDLDLDDVAAQAVTRATRLLGARQAKSRRLAVVLDPLVTRSLLGVVTAALSGEALIKGRSMFAGRDGEVVAAAGVTLADDPTLPEALSAASYDAEGVTTRRTTLIDSGVLTGFLHNGYTGRRSGAGTTGSAMRAGFKSAPGVGCRGLHLVAGARSPDEILRDVGDAFYVQSVQGLHSGANPISGDFSVGAAGLMVRGGALAEPVREVTIASTIQRILLDIAAVGSDLTWYPGTIAGATLLISDMTMSGS